MFASFSAMQMQQIARGWLTAELTGDAAIALGLVAMAYGVPQLLFSLFGGAFADRFEKRKIMIIAQCAMGVLALTNALLVYADVIQVWHLYILGVFQGAVFAFNMPARQAMIPELLDKNDLVNGIALNNAAMNVTRIVAPSIAGIFIAVRFIGLTGVFFAIAALYLIVIYSMFRLPKSPPHAGHGSRSMTQEIGAGLSYIKSSPVLVTLIGLAGVVTVLALPYQTLLPIYARSVHHVGSEGLGLMSTVVGAGALVGSFFVAMSSRHPRMARLQLIMGVGVGVFLLLFSSAVNFPIALVGLALLGFCNTVFGAMNNTLLMFNTAPEYYGRVMSVYMMSFSIMPMAALPASVMADMVGAPWTLSVAGVILVVAVLAVVLLNPAYRKMETAGVPQGKGKSPAKA